MEGEQGDVHLGGGAFVDLFPVKVVVTVRVILFEHVSERNMLGDEENAFLFADCSVGVFVQLVEVFVLLTGTGTSRCPFSCGNVVVAVEIKLGKSFAMFVESQLVFRESTISVGISTGECGLVKGILSFLVFYCSAAWQNYHQEKSYRAGNAIRHTRLL